MKKGSLQNTQQDRPLRVLALVARILVIAIISMLVFIGMSMAIKFAIDQFTSPPKDIVTAKTYVPYTCEFVEKELPDDLIIKSQVCTPSGHYLKVNGEWVSVFPLDYSSHDIGDVWEHA